MKTLLAAAVGPTAGFLMGSRAGHRPYEDLRDLASQRIVPLMDRLGRCE